MSVPEVEEINISCEAGMEESFPGASAPKKERKSGTHWGHGGPACSLNRKQFEN